MANTLVIGAGPAGLTASYELMKLGMPSTILEADDMVGGISRTVNHKGYRFDIGGHRFFSKVPLINELWNEILGDEFLVRPRMSRIHYRGHYFNYPLKPLDALAGLGAMEMFFIGLSYAKAKMLPSREEVNFEQWVSNRFGFRLYNIFFKTYTEKVWGIPCHEIAADWAAQRIKNLSLTEAVRNALFGSGKTKDGKVITTLIDEFNYPRFGPGQMWERCELLLGQGGNETLRGVRVERIRHRNGRVECVVGRKATGEAVEIGADHFISTMPVRELINAFDPAPPDDVVRAANALRYRDYLTVVLMVKREAVFPDNWIYIHTPEVKMGRIQNYKNWSPQMVPDASRTSLGLEYFLWEKDDEWTWPDERLIELGIRECQQIGMIEKGEVEDGCVVRMKKAYPVYDQEYQDHLTTVRRFLGSLVNFQTVGRNGQHRYNNQDHSMLTGVYAARNIAGANYDVWSVNVEKEYHEEGEAKPAAAGDRLVPARVRPVMEPAAEPELSPDEMIEVAFAKLDPVALGTSVGLVAGLVTFLATAWLLVKGGRVIGPNLALLKNFFLGYGVTWLGGIVGMLEAAVGGFVAGYCGARLRNFGMAAYAWILQRRAVAEEERDVLDKV